MQFKKVTSSKYIGVDGFSLQQMRDGSFSIVKGDTVPKWGSKFQTVRSAENFLNSHDYEHSSAAFIPMNEEDIDLIYDIYCTKGDPEFGNKWYITDNFWIKGEKIQEPNRDLVICQFRCSDGQCYRDADDLVEKLDVISNNIFSTVLDKDQVDIIVAKSTILAKRNQPRRPIPKPVRKSGTRISPGSDNGGLTPKDLMRVKSSNVWAIGYQVNNSNRNIGTIYVQFKGKNGGPGDVYCYYDVPNTVYRKMISSVSKGAFVWKYLRYGFAYSKLTGDKRGKLPNAIN